MAWLNAEMAIGVFCRLVSRLVAVTTMSVIWPVSAAAAGCGAAAASCAKAVVVKNSEAASAVLAASIFHFGQLTVRQVKESLLSRGLLMR